MNHDNSDVGRAVRRALGCNPLGIQPRTAACASVLLAMGTPVAMAADAPQGPDTELATITVTGIKASIATAISIKESSDDIIESIAAEDLGKLPDLSIADSIARLPGLAAQRSDGRANFISIRGFASDFSGTTFGGREQASTGENRGVEFDQYPAELINAVQVYKTTDASLIGQGLAGTVNLNTVKPLTFKDPTLALNARAEHNTYGNLNPGQGVSPNGRRLSLSIIDQFFDHTLGVAFGFAQLDSPIQEQQYDAWYWDQNNGNAASALLPSSRQPLDQCCGTPTVIGVPPLAITEEGNQAYARSLSQLRNGLMSVLEWAPNDHSHSQLDLFYSKFKAENYTNGLQWSSAPWGGTVGNPPTPFPIPSYSNVQTSNQNGNAIVTSGILNGVYPIMVNSYTNTATNNFSAGWNHRVAFDNNWTFAGDLSYSSARDTLHQSYAFTGVQGLVVNGIGFQIPVNNGNPHLSVPVNLASPSVVGFTDPDGYSYNGRDESDRQSDIIKAVRLDVVHPLGWIFKTFDLGFDYSVRKKVKTSAVNFAYLIGNGCQASSFIVNRCTGTIYNSSLFVPINSNLLHAPTSLSYVGIPGILDYNVLGAFSSQFYLVPDMSGGDYTHRYSVEEKVPLGYVKLNIDTTLASIPVRGNVGVQFVHTKQLSDAVLTDPNTGQPTGVVTGGASYNERLPSLNLVGDLGNRTFLRIGAGKEMMRGRIDDEKASASASVCTSALNGCVPGTWSGSGGNPNLKPYIAISEDLSFEKIFGQASYFSAALFNKNLTTYIFTQTVLNYDFSGFSSTVKANSPYGTFSTPQDGTGGKIQGYELALTLEGNLFSSWLDGFGLQSSFAYTNNHIPATTLGNVPGGPTSFPGFSKKVAALALYYERYGFSARVAATYRSDFDGEIIANFNYLSYTQIKGETVTNLQAGYEFKEGRAKGLSFLLQINNLTNSPYQTSQVSNFNVGPVVTPLEYNSFGRIILVGVNYKK